MPRPLISDIHVINHIPWNQAHFPRSSLGAAAPRQLAVNLPNRQVGSFLVSSVPPTTKLSSGGGRVSHSPKKPTCSRRLLQPSWFGPPVSPGTRLPLRATRPDGCAAGARRRWSLPAGTRLTLPHHVPSAISRTMNNPNPRPPPGLVAVAVQRASLERVEHLAQGRRVDGGPLFVDFDADFGPARREAPRGPPCRETRTGSHCETRLRTSCCKRAAVPPATAVAARPPGRSAGCGCAPRNCSSSSVTTAAKSTVGRHRPSRPGRASCGWKSTRSFSRACIAAPLRIRRAADTDTAPRRSGPPGTTTSSGWC
jgi:hypothetical protein